MKSSSRSSVHSFSKKNARLAVAAKGLVGRRQALLLMLDEIAYEHARDRSGDHQIAKLLRT